MRDPKPQPGDGKSSIVVAPAEIAREADAPCDDNRPIEEPNARQVREELELRVRERTAELEDARNRAEQAEERLNLALKSSGVGTWSWNVVANSIIWDDYIHPLFGLQPGEFPGRYEDFLKIVLPAERERVDREVAASVSADVTYDTEFQIVWPDGTIHAIGARGKVYRDAVGRALRMTGVCWDVTERRRTAEALAHQSRELARSNVSLANLNADLERAQQALAEIASRLALPALDLKSRTYTLHEFSLTDMIHCGGSIRGMIRNRARSEFDAALVRHFYDRVLGPDGNRALALVRLFETRRLDELDDDLRRVATELEPDLAPDTKCLILAATAGDRSEWNDCTLSSGHRAIPLRSSAAAEQLPMIAQMIRQFGFDVSGIINPQPEILVGQRDAGVFHVPEARGSAYIPAQNEFVIPNGIRSAVGFGGLLPNGRLFAVILFSKVPISHEVAELFGYLSVSARMALLQYLDLPDKSSAQILSLDRLLRNYERVVAEQEHRLRSTLAALVRSNKDLEQFAYVASHDLQEPLRAVAGFCQLLEQRCGDQLDDEGKEFVHFAVEGAERMQEFISGLLDYSRIGTRGKSLELVDANQVLDSVLGNLQVSIQETGAIVRYGELPTVRADRLQLIRLFQNLIGNAIKYRGPSSPEIDVAAESMGGEWKFSVRDNGIGFDIKHADRIFLIFQRLHTRQKYPGTGIGLAICERIVQRHGGRIWAESTPGEGSTFFFTLPRQGAILA